MHPYRDDEDKARRCRAAGCTEVTVGRWLMPTGLTRAGMRPLSTYDAFRVVVGVEALLSAIARPTTCDSTTHHRRP
jgi:hypothetical protein